MEAKSRRSVDELVEAFEEHLRRTRGAHPSISRKDVYYVRLFIKYASDEDLVDVTGFAAQDVIGFITSLVGRYQPATIKGVSTTLRRFFRFLRAEGLRDDHLDDAVPGVVHRRGAGLPRHLDARQLERFIAGLDRSSPRSLRDHAMILCIARLGLRASEVVRLCLEDIDWRAAVLNVPTRKTGHGALLPLVTDVGEAIVEYIEKGRPTTRSRNLFVLHGRRVGEPASPQVVSDAVTAALNKAGVEAPIRGPNLLRHTLATRLIRGGASLKEIADLLGHRCLETTQIYAKLDLESLREVALPWPEVVS
ncbi:MAG: tyrosine-type recombinase/integrase [bacterium]|nr:tyrosine-type recombinase/integrase [bacterium]